MKEEKNFTLSSLFDQLLLEGSFVQAKQAKGIVVIAHGMAEHKERYFRFMHHLAKQGYSSVILDMRGHGKSIRKDDDLGYFYDDTASACLKDLHQLIGEIKKKSHLPLFLFGHSMGSLLVRVFTKSYDYELDGLIVCGSPSENALAPLAIRMVKVMKTFKGDHYRSRFIHHMAFSAYAKRFEEHNSENVWLSEYQKNVEEYDKDPLCGFVFTLNGFENLFKLMKNAYHTKGWNVQNKDLPILFIAGANDPCIDSVEKFTKAWQQMKKVGYHRIDYHLFKNMRHEILCEEDCEKVYTYLDTWLSKNILSEK